MSRLSHGGSKWKGLRATNAGGVSFDNFFSSSSSIKKASGDVISYDIVSSKDSLLLIHPDDKQKRSQCVADYIAYTHQKEKNKTNPFDRFLR